MAQYTDSDKREYIRLDSIFPVEFQFLTADTYKVFGNWRQAFTADVSEGGLCISASGLDEHELNWLKDSSNFVLGLKIHIPLFGVPISAMAKIAWISQDSGSLTGAYSIGLKYALIDMKDKKRIMRLAYGKMIMPRLMLWLFAALFVVFALFGYHNFELSLAHQKLIEEIISAAQDLNTGRKQLQDIRKDKEALENQLQEANAKINSMRQDLQLQIDSMEQDLNKMQTEKRQEYRIKDAAAQELKNTIAKLELEKNVLAQKIGGLVQKEELTSARIGGMREKKIILEKANFEKMYQWLKIHQNYRTGLVASFEGDWTLNGQAFSYDEALSALAFTYFKDYALARKIFDFYLTKARFEKGFYNAYYVSGGEPAEFIIHTGPNLWLGIAVLQYTYLSQDTKYLGLAKKIASWIMNLQEEDPASGLRGGPDVKWFSTEHNLDGFAFFNMLYQLTQEDIYQQRAQEILNWLKNNAYDHPDVPIKRGKGDATIATDTYTWSIASLGPQTLIKIGMDPEAIIRFAEDNCSVTIDYERLGGEKVSVKGFDFAKARHSARNGVISTEWTAQMALSYKILSKYFASQGQSAKEKAYQDKAESCLEELTKMVITSPSPTGQGEGCLPYASADFVDTGHGWYTPKGKSTGSVSATAYAIFAYYGFNPLEFKTE